MSAEKFRASSAVLLTRSEGREVFLVERALELKFFGGYWACPGGVVDPADLDAVRATERGVPSRAELARCAARELFEETGVLLPELDSSDALTPPRTELRNQLLAEDSASWTRMLRHESGGFRGLESLEHVCTLTTPPFAPVRYRTEFWQLDLPNGESPLVELGELVRGEFFSPEEVLERWIRGEMFVVPPVLFLLEQLAGRPLKSALDRARSHSREIASGRLSEIRHTPGIFTAPLATPTIPPATTTNCYLVGEERVFVLDPATWEVDERARLFRLMDRWLADGRTFAGVLVSHHHQDHIGSVVEVAERYQLEVLAHPLTLERLPELPCGSRALTDGDRLELGVAPDGREGWGLSVFHTPGHDRGHLVFVEDRYGAALVGDLVSTLSTIVIDPPEGHLATYLASLKRMATEEFGVLYPAHGPAVRNGVAAVRQFIEHREARESQLLAGLEAGLASEEELTEEVYRGTPSAVMPMARRSLLAGLEKLSEEGRVRCDRGRWVPIR